MLCLLAGCAGGSAAKLNPFNWFKQGEKTVKTFNIEAPADPRPLIAEVVSMRFEQVPTGVLVTAVGRGDTQGVWAADLVALPAEEGELVLEFRAMPIEAPAGTARSREVTAGVFISRAKLFGVGRILVEGARNAVTARP